jgi:hypothetical protein
VVTVQLRDRPGLAPEAFSSVRVLRNLLQQELDGNALIEFYVVRLDDHTHAPSTNDRVNLVFLSHDLADLYR